MKRGPLTPTRSPQGRGSAPSSRQRHRTPHDKFTLPQLLEQLAADQHAPNLAGAGADLIELDITQIAPGRIIVDVAVAAEKLARVKRHSRRILRRIENGAGCVLARC